MARARPADWPRRAQGGGIDTVITSVNHTQPVTVEIIRAAGSSSGADTFVYLAVSNSRTGVAARDVINGFARAPGEQDRIDLSAIDANTTTAANDAFTFIGTGAFTAAGQVRVQGLGGPNAVIVEVNVNADLAADMQIFVNLQTTMVAGDFIL